MTAAILRPGSTEERLLPGDFGLTNSSFILTRSLKRRKADHTGGSHPQERSERKGSHDRPAPLRRVVEPAMIERLERIGSAYENTSYLQPWDGRRPDDVPAATRHA